MNMSDVSTIFLDLSLESCLSLTMETQYKRRKIDEQSATTTTTTLEHQEHQQQEKILQYLQSTALNQEDIDEAEVYDLEWLENLSKQLGSTIKQNSDIRIKYSNDPLKFLDSETRLNELVKQISNITLAELPLYNDFIRLSADYLKDIISHPNNDIINQFIRVFNDLIDHEYEQDQIVLLQFIKSQNILEFLLSYLQNLPNDEEESQDIRITILNIFNELTNYQDEELRLELIGFDDFTEYLSNTIRLSLTTIGQITYYHELIADYLFNIANWNKVRFVNKHKYLIEVLLVQLSHFTTQVPEDGSTQESFIDSSISILITLLTTKQGRSTFLQNEGFELLLILIKNGSWGFKTFVKMANYLVESINDTNNVELSISIIESNFFLNNVFKVLKQGTSNGNGGVDRDEIYQVLKMLVKLIIFLPFNSDQRIRLINKLVNKNFKSLDVILKIETKYDQNVFKIEGGVDGYSFDDYYLRKIENGLDILQQISIFKSWLLIEDDKLKNDMIHMKHFNLEKLKHILTGYKDELQFNIENTEDQDVKNEFFEYISMINELLANLDT